MADSTEQKSAAPVVAEAHGVDKFRECCAPLALPLQRQRHPVGKLSCCRVLRILLTWTTLTRLQTRQGRCSQV
jgi:hypothetical protein